MSGTASDPDALLAQAEARETALRDVLKLIETSRDDEGPVFQTILSSAAQLCDAPMARLHLVSGDRRSFSVAAFWGEAPRTMKPGDSWPLDPDITLWKTLIEGQTLHLEDHATTENYLRGDPIAVSIVEKEGIRTRVSVPLIRAGQPIGAITLSRRDVNPFRQADIALVETFAAQAVIAIENVRQFRELQTRLERETATRKILHVISQSRDDQAPVFDAILADAARLCDAPMASLNLLDERGERLVLRAHWGQSMQHFVPGETTWAVDGGAVTAEAVRAGRLLHVEDMRETEIYRQGDPVRVKSADEEGLRTFLAVPLMLDGRAIGSLDLFRRDVRPFDDRHVGLVETFAAQAVIAIENVRQFRELQDRLEREAATREILEVISQSRDDETPVFEAVLKAAARLCNADMAGLMLGRPDGDHLTLTALYNPDFRSDAERDAMIADANDPPMAMDPTQHISAQAICSGEIVRIEDLSRHPRYLDGEHTFRSMVEGMGSRSLLCVPLRDDAGPLGAIMLHRRQVHPFTADQAALVQTFAAQAVIAIENVRQFRDLQSRLEREAASREILSAISRSRADPTAVFEIILRNSLTLCRAPQASLSLVTEDGAQLVPIARQGHVDDPDQTFRRTGVPLDQPGMRTTAVRERRTMHVYDVRETEFYKDGEPNIRALADVLGARTALLVPLISGEDGIGVLLIYRNEIKPFTADEITLVETFAAQAVIAIENVRQFRELQTRLEREAATREILQAISKSRDDEAPVFDVILEQAARLCHSPQAGLIMANQQRTAATYTAYWGTPSKYFEPGVTAWDMNSPIAITTAIREGRVVNIADTKSDDRARQEHPDRQEIIEKEEIRSVLAVPLMHGDLAIGCIDVYRREVNPFSDEDVRLLENFAAQAVIAIENVRQFRELQTRLEREAASREILSVISRSRDNELPVFDVILKNAVDLCDAQAGRLVLVSEDRMQTTTVSVHGPNADTSRWGPGLTCRPPMPLRLPSASCGPSRSMISASIRAISPATSWW